MVPLKYAAYNYTFNTKDKNGYEQRYMCCTAKRRELIKDQEVKLTDIREEDKLNKKLFLRTAEEKAKRSAERIYVDEAVFDLDTKKVVVSQIRTLYLNEDTKKRMLTTPDATDRIDNQGKVQWRAC